ncbi:coiled-coil domain-containing protein 190 [Kogia breviceps]|uniref:coiled-coil domain-containing protein 190 n=1 Tax=Kogia breviceps TaxID=27615 RepID=UPI002795E4C1|nr:coiled-coil domain-containing protein 190 [Kogia breviceps]
MYICYCLTERKTVNHCVSATAGPHALLEMNLSQQLEGRIGPSLHPRQLATCFTASSARCKLPQGAVIWTLKAHYSHTRQLNLVIDDSLSQPGCLRLEITLLGNIRLGREAPLPWGLREEKNVGTQAHRLLADAGSGQDHEEDGEAHGQGTTTEALYHVKWLTREQRQLQKELQRLQQDIIKKKFSSYFENGSQKRPDVLTFSSQGGQKHRVLQANKFRALTTNTIQEIYKTKSQMPPFHHIGPKDPMKSKRQSLSQNNRNSYFTKEKPQAQEKYSINPLKGKDSNKGISLLCQDQDVSTQTLDQGPSSSPAGGSRMVHGDETRSNDANKRPDHTAGKQIPPNPIECGGNFKGEPKTSTYSELFAKARNIHYFRHRVPPESERLLSIGEIFGHKESSQSRSEKWCKNRVTI